MSAFGVAIDFSNDIVKMANTSRAVDKSAAHRTAPTSRCIGHNATVYTVRSEPNAVESRRCAMRNEPDTDFAYQKDWHMVKR